MLAPNRAGSGRSSDTGTQVLGLVLSCEALGAIVAADQLVLN